MNTEAMYKTNYSEEPNWKEAEDMLFANCVEAVTRFAEENPSRTCSFLAFDSEPCYGYVFISLDTPENALQEAKREQDYEVQNRVKQFSREGAWQSAHYYIAERPSLAHSHNTGAFEFEQYQRVDFEGWEEFVQGESYPEAEEQNKDYLANHTILIFWRVIERLIEEGVLNVLKLASPFRLGYNFHDGKLIVVRIINWPE
jgi:hypothetical protein